MEGSQKGGGVMNDEERKRLFFKARDLKDEIDRAYRALMDLHSEDQLASLARSEIRQLEEKLRLLCLQLPEYRFWSEVLWGERPPAVEFAGTLKV
jgi:hypothetical protein